MTKQKNYICACACALLGLFSRSFTCTHTHTHTAPHTAIIHATSPRPPFIFFNFFFSSLLLQLEEDKPNFTGYEIVFDSPIV